MKKLLIIGALMCAPIAVMAQDTMMTTEQRAMYDGWTAEQRAAHDAWSADQQAWYWSMPANNQMMYWSWPASNRTWFNTLTIDQRNWFWTMPAAQQTAWWAMTPDARMMAWTNASARASVAAPRVIPSTAPAQRVFAPMTSNPAPAAMMERPPVCTATLRDNCQNAGEGGAPGRSRALPYWPGEPRSETQ